MSGIYVITPSVRPGPDWKYFQSFIGDDKPTDGVIHLPIHGKPADAARNIGIRKMLESPAAKGFDYVLFADDDAGWAKGSMVRMIEDLNKPGVDAVTACIYKRSNPPVCPAGHYRGVNDKGHHYYDLSQVSIKIFERATRAGLTSRSSNMQLLNREDGDLLEIDGCGAHFIMVKRSALELISPPWFVGNAMGGGEDFFFCRKLKEFGYRIYIDLGIHTSHEAGQGVSFGISDWMQVAELAGGVENLTRYFEELQDQLT